MGRKTVERLGGWDGYRAVKVEIRPGDGQHGRSKAVIELAPKRRTMRCARCGAVSRRVHETVRRRVRDLPLFDVDVVLIVPRRRLWCPRCDGPQLEHLEWLGAHRRVTRRLEAAVAKLVSAMPVKRVAAFYGLDWHTRTTSSGSGTSANPGYARRFWQQWHERAMASGIEPLMRFARRLTPYLEGILAHCRHPLHTGVIEGINNRIKVIKRMVYGFRDSTYFFLKIRAAFRGIAR